MESLIKKLKQYNRYTKMILNKLENTELEPINGNPWLFFNKESIIEYTTAYQIQQYRGPNTLLIAQDGDDGLLAIMENNKTKLVINDLGSLNPKFDLIVQGNLNDIMTHLELLNLNL